MSDIVTPDKMNSEDLLQSLLTWAMTYEPFMVEKGRFPELVRLWRGLYQDEIIFLEELEDEEARKKGPFAIDHFFLEEEEKVLLVAGMHSPTVRVSFRSQTNQHRNYVLGRFATMIVDTIEIYKTLFLSGGRFVKT